MTATPVPFDEQMKLIMECRSSGLSDHQWCLEHDIKPGTFYNWVKRHRKCGNSLPAPAGRQLSPHVNDIVKLEPEKLQQEPASPLMYEETAGAVSLELVMNGTVLRISNDVKPELLAHTIHVLKGMTC